MRKSPFSPSQPLFYTPLLLTLIFILVSVLISVLALDRRRNKRRRRKRMEKTKQKTTAKQYSDNSTNSRQVVWDCGSSLYDSFELKAIEKELDSAIASSRASSMPHLSHGRPPPPPSSKKPITSKISRSLNRLIRSVCRPKNNSNINSKKEGFDVVYDRSGPLSTVPEVPVFDGPSPEFRSFLRRTASDRSSAKIVPR